MRLSYSLLEHYQTCQYRTKLVDFDRVPRVEAVGSAFRAMIGDLAHEGQRAVVLGEDPRTAIRRKLWRYEETPLPEGWDAPMVVDRCCGMVARWMRSVPSFDPKACEAAVLVHEGEQRKLADARLVVPLEPKIGVFDSFVFKPDLVCYYGPQRFLRLYDWKWVGDLNDTEDSPYDYDLQSAMYQWGLHQLGLDVKCCGIVEGLIEEPTPFKLNKDGTVSRRAIRNSYEEYVRACEQAGCEVDESMRDRLTPTFRHHVNFRSFKEVEAIWERVVIPTAAQITRSVADGFVRCMKKSICGRCSLRESCRLGLLGQHQEPAFNTIIPHAEVA